MKAFKVLAIWLMASTLSAQKYYIDLSSPKYRSFRIFLNIPPTLKEFEETLRYDLGAIGYFEVVDSKEFSDGTIYAIGVEDEFAVFLKDRADRHIDGLRFKVASDLEYAAHLFANRILKTLTGLEPGPFGIPLVFVSDKTGHKEIYMLNFISKTIKKLTRHGSVSMSPTISPSGKKIAYISFVGGRPELFVIDFAERKIRKARGGKGIYMSPRFLDNARLFLSWDDGTEAKIYLLNLLTGSIERMTSGPMDVMASPSPDGKYLVFTSRRSGSPQIYIMDLEEGRIRRLLLKGRYNASPAWSPKGKEIAFVKLEEGKFNIYIYNLETQTERKLTDGIGSSESPTWTPDGNFIVFASSRDGDYDLYITDRMGSFLYKTLDTPYNETQPCFSRR